MFPKEKELCLSTKPDEVEGTWPKHLPMIQVTAVSLSSRLSIRDGTVVRLEAESKVLSRRKAKVMTKNNNEELVARCRVYQQVGPLDNQRVTISVSFHI